MLLASQYGATVVTAPLTVPPASSNTVVVSLPIDFPSTIAFVVISPIRTPQRMLTRSLSSVSPGEVELFSFYFIIFCSLLWLWVVDINDNFNYVFLLSIHKPVLYCCGWIPNNNYFAYNNFTISWSGSFSQSRLFFAILPLIINHRIMSLTNLCFQ